MQAWLFSSLLAGITERHLWANKGGSDMALVNIRNLSKNYGKGENEVKALKHVNLEINQGEFVALLGTSGSGKSTLLNVIGGLDVVTEGEIMIDGHNIAKLNRKELAIFRRRKIGFVFQNYSLMPVLNVYDNVALPVSFDKSRHIDHAYMERLLKDLKIWDKRMKYPSELSGGQQQRAAIARALANKPALILADEPTGNLDSKTTNDVIGLLKASGKQYNQTILMVTHNEVIAQNCDRIIRIEDGILYENGKGGGLHA